MAFAAAGLLALGFWARTGLRPGADEVRVHVDAAHIVRTLDARLFGLNAVMWDPYFDTPGTVSALRELNAQALRFPGGSPSDDYHWASNRNGANPWTWATPFSSFVHVATNLHAQAFITVNYGSGTPEEAARTGAGSPDIAPTTFTGAAAEFPCKFPPYSATVIALSPLRANPSIGLR
ncbi:MAG: hypothetical protein ABSH34_02970 [Verrucomicrobiota bacterium]